jgi:hypothetical protein
MSIHSRKKYRVHITYVLKQVCNLKLRKFSARLFAKFKLHLVHALNAKISPQLGTYYN